MDKEAVAIFVKNKEIKEFIESFFKKSKIYEGHFFKTAETFLSYIKEDPPQAVITDTSLLPSISDRITRFPIIAVITGNVKKGITTAINHNVSRYMYRPYIEQDLAYKLEDLILEKDAIENMKSEMRELEMITEIMQFVSSTLDPKEILFRVVKKISEFIPVTRCSIIRVDWLRKNAFVVATFEDPNIVGMKLNLRKYPEIMKALSSKNPVFIKDVGTDPLMQKVKDFVSPLGIRSILVIPVLLQKKVIGTLFLRTSKKELTFSAIEVRLLNAVAHASANSLYNAMLYEQVEDEKIRLEKLAVKDYLTGIYNIRYFYQRIIEEFSRCQRYGYPISCLMLDIDYFKKVNDVFGHKTGDATLREFAQLLDEHSRKSDVLARYGGEEFIILLPQTSLEGAITEAERIRALVKNYTFKSLKGKKRLTVSIGIATYPLIDVQSHDELITFSDDALFTAKQRGRNQVMVYGKDK